MCDRRTACVCVFADIGREVLLFALCRYLREENGSEADEACIRRAIKMEGFKKFHKLLKVLKQ